MITSALRGIPLLAFSIFFLLLGQPGEAQEMRTWTSASGATVTAKYAGMESGEVLLENAEGKKLTIRPDLLSAADREYLRALTETRPPVRPKIESSLQVQDIPGLTLNEPARAYAIGFYVGPAPEDIIYFVLDHSAGSDVADILYAYSPGLSAYQQVKSFSGRSLKEGRVQYVEFPDFPLAAQLGPIAVNHKLTLTAGAVRADLVWVKIDSTYTEGAQTTPLQVTGNLNNLVQYGPGVIPVIPAAVPLKLGIRMFIEKTTKSAGTPVEGTLVYEQDLILVGPERLLASMNLIVKDADGNVVEERKFNLAKISPFPSTLSGISTVKTELKKLEPEKNYVAESQVDLGPMFGIVKGSAKFSVPAK